MKVKNSKTEKRDRRHKRIRARVQGSANRPRLSVFKSNKYMYGQIIDDTKGVTLVAVSDMELKGKGVERAKEAGSLLAKKAKEKKIESVVFDRGGFIYTGRVKAFAEGARDGGLIF